MQLHQALDQCQAQPEPATGAFAVVPVLHEELEDAGQHFRRDADAVVADANHSLPARAFDVDFDQPSVRTVLAGIVQQIAQHLRQARCIGVDQNRLRRRAHLELVTRLVECRPHGLQCIVDRLQRVHRRALEHDAPVPDARQLQQVVDQMRHLLDLTLDQRHRHAANLCALARTGQHRRGIQDRTERIAQLVAHGGQELVLVPVGGFQCQAGLHQRRDVQRMAEHSQWLVPQPAQRAAA